MTPNISVFYKAIRDGAGLVDFRPRTRVELIGRDAPSFLHNLCTNDICQLPTGYGCEAFLTDVRGKVLANLFVFCGEKSLWLETVPDQSTDIIRHLAHYRIREQVQWHDRTETWGAWLLAGRDSPELLMQVIRVSLPTEPFQHINTSIAEHSVKVAQVPLTGPRDFLLLCDQSTTVAVGQALQTLGAVLCPESAFQTARIEQGTPLYGRDITQKNFPQEIGRDAQAISFTKGCYLGQETVARIDALGHVNQKLVLLRFEASDVPSAGTPLMYQEQVVGQVTSATHSPRHDAPIALAYVRREQTSPNTLLTCTTGQVRVLG